MGAAAEAEVALGVGSRAEEPLRLVGAAAWAGAEEREGEGAADWQT